MNGFVEWGCVACEKRIDMTVVPGRSFVHFLFGFCFFFVLHSFGLRCPGSSRDVSEPLIEEGHYDRSDDIDTHASA